MLKSFHLTKFSSCIGWSESLVTLPNCRSLSATGGGGDFRTTLYKWTIRYFKQSFHQCRHIHFFFFNLPLRSLIFLTLSTYCIISLTPHIVTGLYFYSIWSPSYSLTIEIFLTSMKYNIKFPPRKSVFLSPFRIFFVTHQLTMLAYFLVASHKTNIHTHTHCTIHPIY